MSLNTSSKKEFSDIDQTPPLTVNRIKEVDIKISVT